MFLRCSSEYARRAVASTRQTEVPRLLSFLLFFFKENLLRKVKLLNTKEENLTTNVASLTAFSGYSPDCDRIKIVLNCFAVD